MLAGLLPGFFLWTFLEAHSNDAHEPVRDSAISGLIVWIFENLREPTQDIRRGSQVYLVAFAQHQQLVKGGEYLLSWLMYGADNGVSFAGKTVEVVHNSQCRMGIQACSQNVRRHQLRYRHLLCHDSIRAGLETEGWCSDLVMLCTCCRLVQEEDGGVPHQATSNTQSPLLPTRKPTHWKSTRQRSANLQNPGNFWMLWDAQAMVCSRLYLYSRCLEASQGILFTLLYIRICLSWD